MEAQILAFLGERAKVPLSDLIVHEDEEEADSSELTLDDDEDEQEVQKPPPTASRTRAAAGARSPAHGRAATPAAEGLEPVGRAGGAAGDWTVPTATRLDFAVEGHVKLPGLLAGAELSSLQVTARGR